MKTTLVKRFMATVLIAVAITMNMPKISDAYAGEDSWEMVDRIFYHSGSWWLSTGHIVDQGKIHLVVELVEVWTASPEEEYAEGRVIITPNTNSEQYADFIMLRGQVVSFQEPGTNKTVLRMKKF